MLTINDLGYDVGGRWLFRHVNWTVTPGKQIGLVGRNGTGKTTLLRLINGELTPTEGKISYGKDFRIGFLTQDLLDFQTEDSILNVAMSGFRELQQLEDRLNELLNTPAEQQNEAWLEELGQVQETFQTRGGYEMEARTHEVLAGLGFSSEDAQRPYDTFSGGWRMRVMLARLLLQAPDILLLDEPTNHLDLPAIEWLETYLQKYQGTSITVSHDREFLDRLTSHTVEVSSQQLHFYTGNYSRYLKEREERMELHRAAYRNQQKMIADTERFIERFRAQANKAQQVQSRIKQLDKLERVPEPEEDAPTVNMQFKVAAHSGKELLQFKGLSKSFGDIQVLENTDAQLFRGDKVGLVGPNGIGKSTLLRIIGGTEPIDAGERQTGYRVHISLFSQHQLEDLQPQNSIFQELMNFAMERGETYVRNILGGFMFSGDDIEKPIAVLSGGERSRVALAKTLLSESNTLLLDEPTNHLDIPSIDVLIRAMQNYEGSFVVVSHNRHFLREVCNKIWYIHDRQLKEYPGTYSEFEDHLRRNNLNVFGPAPATIEAPSKAASTQPAASNGQSEAERKARRKLENRIVKLEKEVEELETKLQNTQAKLEDPANASNVEKLAELQQAYNKLTTRQEKKMAEWEAAQAELEQAH